MPFYRAKHAIAILGSSLYVSGGINESYVETQEVWRLTDNTWVIMTDTAEFGPLAGHVMGTINNNALAIVPEKEDNIPTLWLSTDGATWCSTDLATRVVDPVTVKGAVYHYGNPKVVFSDGALETYLCIGE